MVHQAKDLAPPLLSNSAAAYLARARDIVPQLAASSDAIETERQLTPEILRALHERALFRPSLPSYLGGGELTPADLAHITEIIATADASTAWCLGQAYGCAMSAAFMDQEPAKTVFGPGEAVLAWGAGVQGRAIETDGGYRVTGRWQFASGSKHATWLGGHSRVFTAEGTAKKNSSGGPVLRTVLFPRAEAAIEDDWHVIGLCGTRSESYAVENLFVPAPLSLDRDMESECRHNGTLYKFPTTSVYAGAFSGVALGIARAALDDLLALAMTKKPRGARSSLRDSAVFQSQLAEMQAQWAAARAYQQDTLMRIWDAADATGHISQAQRIDIRLATTYAIRQATSIVENVYRLAGSTAIFDAEPFARRLRDAYSVSQQVQGRHTHFETVGRHMLGLEVETIFI